jgi:glycosyltransferase involved in cell wall biosynthesis
LRLRAKLGDWNDGSPQPVELDGTCEKLKILLLTQIVPYPPDSGPKVKTFHVLRYLAENGHRLTLVSFVRKHEERYLQDLKQYCAETYSAPIYRSRRADLTALAQSLRSGLPFLVTRDAHLEMQQLVCRLTRQPFDIIHADQLTMAQFALQFRGSSRANCHSSPSLVFDAHNAVYEIVKRAGMTAPHVLRPVMTLEAGRIKHYEGRLIHEFDHTLAVSQVDRRALLQAAESAKTSVRRKTPPQISVIPIAVDSDRLRPINRAEHSQDILSISTLFYPPNADGLRWFLNQVFPVVRHQVPDAKLAVVGPRPPRDILEFGRRNSECVRVSGYVSDLQPYLERAGLIIVPVRAASGMRVRILEALARGIPVVTTTTGLEGIDAVNREHLLVADEPEGFAEAVVTLLKNPTLGEQMARNGRRLVEDKYDWQRVLPKLEAVYESLVQK